MLRRTALDQLGGLDETLPMYLEDLDLCAALDAACWSVHYEPSVQVRHIGAESTSRSPRRTLLRVIEDAHAPWLLALGHRRGDGRAGRRPGGRRRSLPPPRCVRRARPGGRHPRIRTRAENEAAHARELFTWALGDKADFTSRARSLFDVPADVGTRGAA